MFGFYFKKNLCDVWDNIFYVVITNFFALLSFFIVFALFKFELSMNLAQEYAKLVYFATFLFSCVLVCTVAFTGGKNAFNAANFNTPRYGDFFGNFLPSIKDGLFAGIFIGMVSLVGSVSIPFYFRMWKPADGSTGSILWLAFIVVIFWFLVTTFFAMQWFIPVRVIMKNGYFKCLKKCYILFIDNMSFTFGMFGVNILNLLLTVVTFGLFPGMTGIIFTNMNALRMRLYKYDWIEVNPDLTPEERRNVPWDDLIAKDMKTLGPRPLKSFIFPWKE